MCAFRVDIGARGEKERDAMWATFTCCHVQRCRSEAGSSRAHISAVFEQERHRISSAIVGSEMQGCTSTIASVHILSRCDERAKPRAIAVYSRVKNIAHRTTAST